MTNEKEIEKARKEFEKYLLIKGVDNFNWTGRKYDRVNIQNKWRYFSLGYFSKQKEQA